jgi:hypothetical protein
MAASEKLAHIVIMEVFRCPKCGTQQIVARMVQLPVWKPVYMRCGWLFTPIENEDWLVYRIADLTCLWKALRVTSHIAAAAQ